MPIGNLTSQFWANVYLDPFDRLIKEEFRIKGYIRYMDDFVLFGHEPQRLLQLRPELERWLAEQLNLTVKPGATLLQPSSHGLSFLGMRIFPRFLRVQPKNRRRSLRKMRQRIAAWRQGWLSEGAMQQSLQSISGHLRYFCPKMPLAEGIEAE